MEQPASSRRAHHRGPTHNGSTAPRPLIERANLAAWLSRPAAERPHLLDVRWALGRPAADSRALYAEGHLPGAVFVDLDADLSEPAGDGHGGRHPAPSPEHFQTAMRAAGVTQDRPVVVYDDRLSLGAARCWWLLQWAGKHDVQVLEGGYAGWVAGEKDTETGVTEPEEGDLVVAAGSRDAWTAQDVLASLSSDAGRVGLVDARPESRFRGEEETVDPVAGHIPGAVNLPALSLVDNGGRFIGRERLLTRLRDAGLNPQDPPVIYCGSGVQAAHAALAWEAALPEAPQPGVYLGSWSDWITDPSRPVAGPGRDGHVEAGGPRP